MNAVLEILETIVDNITVRDIIPEERKLFGGKCGFIVAFDYDESFSKKKIGQVLDVVKRSSDDVKRSFLIGAFDSKASDDIDSKYMAMDVKTFEIGSEFNKIAVELELTPKPVNKGRKRANPNQKDRLPQVRMDLAEYYDKLGIISPSKCEKAALLLNKNVKIVDSPLPNTRKL